MERSNGKVEFLHPNWAELLGTRSTAPFFDKEESLTTVSSNSEIWQTELKTKAGKPYSWEEDMKNRPRRPYWDSKTHFYFMVLIYAINLPEPHYVIRNYILGGYHKDNGKLFYYFIGYFVSKVTLTWVINYILYGLGMYHKSGIFQIGEMLPVAGCFPAYFTFLSVLAVVTRIQWYLHHMLTVVKILIHIVFHTRDPVNCKDIERGKYLPICINISKVISPVNEFCHIDSEDFIVCPGKVIAFPVTIMLWVTDRELHWQVFNLIFMMGVITFWGVIAFKSVNAFEKTIKWTLLSNFILLLSVLFILWDTVGYPGGASNMYGASLISLSKLEIHSFFQGLFSGFPSVACMIINIYSCTARVKRAYVPAKAAFVATIFNITYNFVVITITLFSVHFTARMFNMEPKMAKNIYTGINLNALLVGLNEFPGAPLVWKFIFLSSTTFMCLLNEGAHLEALLFNMTAFSAAWNRRKFSLIKYSVFGLFISVTFLVFFKHDLRAILSIRMIGHTLALLGWLVIMIFYSLSTFKMDMEFMTGRRPSRVINVACYTMIIICEISLLYNPLSVSTLSTAIVIASCHIVLFLLFFVELIRYKSPMRNKFVPVFYYGPPNTEMRRARKLYESDK